MIVRKLGRVGYADGLRLQRELVEKRRDGAIPDTLLLLEHDPVITKGKVAREGNVLLDDAKLAKLGVTVVETDRGGDVTYHGPGQIVGYPILDLAKYKTDLKWYVEQLEEVMIRVCRRHKIPAARSPGMTGAWVGTEKIGAIGVRVQRWITSHGFALNVNVNLDYFGLIIPCGLQGKGVTSLSALLKRPVDLGGIQRDVAEEFGEVFNRKITVEA